MTTWRLLIIVAPMLDLLVSVLAALRSLLKSEHHQALQMLAQRQQLAIYKRTAKRPKLRAADRVFWVWLSRLWSNWCNSLGSTVGVSSSTSKSMKWSWS